MRRSITIDPKISSLMRALTASEEAGLRASLERDGCTEPLIVWAGNDILLDGHNRYGIILDLGIDFPVHEVKLASQDEAIEWVIRRQLGRRNLSEEQAAYYRAHRHILERRAPHRPDEKGGHDVHLNGKEQAKGKTRDKIGEVDGVSGRTVTRDVRFAEAVDRIGEYNPKMKRLILSGEAKCSRADVLALGDLVRKHSPTAALVVDGEQPLKGLAKPKVPQHDAFARAVERTESLCRKADLPGEAATVAKRLRANMGNAAYVEWLERAASLREALGAIARVS